MTIRVHTLLISIGVTLAGCANRPPPEPARISPVAWAQTEGELDRLPVGHVVQVTREVQQVKVGSDTDRTFVFLYRGVPILIPISTRASLHGEAFFRHVIRLKGSGELIGRDEYAPFELGSCVAIRENPQLVVPAHAKACD